MLFATRRSGGDPRGVRRAAAFIRRAAPDVLVTQSIDAQVIGHVIARRLDALHLTVEHGDPGLRVHRSPRAERSSRRTSIASWRSHRPRRRPCARSASGRIGSSSSQELQARYQGPARARGRGSRAGHRPRRHRCLARGHPPAREAGDAVRRGRRTRPFALAVVAASLREEGPTWSRCGSEPPLWEGGSCCGDPEDVGDLVWGADVVCLTSSAEGLPMIVLEAMALGRPVLSTAVGGIPDVVTSGDRLARRRRNTRRDRRCTRVARDRPRAEASDGTRGTRQLRGVVAWLVRMADEYAAVLRQLVRDTQAPDR